MKCDRESKIITDLTVTDASVHDSQELAYLIDKHDNHIDLDAGYVGQKRIEKLLEDYPNIINLLDFFIQILMFSEVAYNS